MSQDPQHFMPPTLMGTVYWKDHVVAVIDDHAEAERAREVLLRFRAHTTKHYRSNTVVDL